MSIAKVPMQWSEGDIWTAEVQFLSNYAHGHPLFVSTLLFSVLKGLEPSGDGLSWIA